MELEISWTLNVCSLRPTARVIGSMRLTGYHRRLAKLHSVLARACKDPGGRGGQG